MAHRVVILPEARAHLRGIQRYIAEASSADRAAKYMARLTGAIGCLADAPYQGTRREDLKPGLRTTGFERRVTIVFAVNDPEIVIVAVLYAGRENF